MNTRIPTIQIEGRGSASAAPDQVTLSFQIQERTRDYTDCLHRLADRVHHLRADLLSVDLPLQDLRTGHLGIQPQYAFHEGVQTFQGYEAQQHLTIRIPLDQDRLSRILAVLGRSESKAEFNLQFGLADQESLRKEALTRAMAQCRQDAEVLASAAGMGLDKLVDIRYGSEPHRMEGGLHVRMSAMKDESPLVVDPEDIRIEIQVTASWQLSAP